MLNVLQKVVMWKIETVVDVKRQKGPPRGVLKVS